MNSFILCTNCSVMLIAMRKNTAVDRGCKMSKPSSERIHRMSAAFSINFPLHNIGYLAYSHCKLQPKLQNAITTFQKPRIVDTLFPFISEWLETWNALWLSQVSGAVLQESLVNQSVANHVLHVQRRYRWGWWERISSQQSYCHCKLLVQQLFHILKKAIAG